MIFAGGCSKVKSGNTKELEGAIQGQHNFTHCSNFAGSVYELLARVRAKRCIGLGSSLVCGELGLVFPMVADSWSLVGGC